MLSFEQKWKIKRNEVLRNGQRDPKQLAMSAQHVIDEIFIVQQNELRIIYLFQD